MGTFGAGEMAEDELGGGGWKQMSRSGLGQTAGTFGSIWQHEGETVAGMGGSLRGWHFANSPEATPGNVFFCPVAGTWLAEVPGRLCKARGGLAGRRAKPRAQGEWGGSEPANSCLCPREPEKRPDRSAWAGGVADSFGSCRMQLG